MLLFSFRLTLALFSTKKNILRKKKWKQSFEFSSGILLFNKICGRINLHIRNWKTHTHTHTPTQTHTHTQFNKSLFTTGLHLPFTHFCILKFFWLIDSTKVCTSKMRCIVKNACINSKCKRTLTDSSFENISNRWKARTFD